MIYKCIFNIAPVPASRARVTRWGTYFPKKYTKYRKEMYQLLCGMNSTPDSSLLDVNIKFWIEMPKSWSKKKKYIKVDSYCDNNADIDNYIKAVLDSCEGFYFENDKQVVKICGIKKYAEVGRIEYEQKTIEAMS